MAAQALARCDGGGADGFHGRLAQQVWPWKETAETYLDSHGVAQPLVQHNVAPGTFEQLTGQPSQLVQAVLLCVVGFLAIYGIELLADNIVECRANMLALFSEYMAVTPDYDAWHAASHILSLNLIHGDALSMRVADGGPLAGLCASLAQIASGGEAATPWVFVVATDMPFLRPALIEQLANYRSGVDAVVPLVDGHPQPLAAFYSIDALPAVRALATGNGKRSLRAALERLQVAYVHAADLIAADPGLGSFVDLDTPEDLAKAIDQKEG